MIKIAIVGSEEKYWTPEQRRRAVEKINEALHNHGWESDGYGYDWYSSGLILVSGGCPKGGVDIWAEVVADVYGIQKEIHYPEVDQWEDVDNRNHSDGNILKGFKSRNIEIAESCDILYCIDPKSRKWSGGRWTMNYAKSLGKKTELIIIE